MSLSVTVLGCAGTFAGPDQACSGYLVRSDGATVVVDLGSGTLANLQRHVAVADLDAVVLSHEHPDHWLDLPILRNAMRYVLGLEGLPVYGTAGVLAEAADLIGEVDPTFALATVTAGAEVEVGDLRFRFDRTDHPVETLAVRADADGGSLLYSADTGPGWDPTGFGDGVDLFLCEGTYTPDQEGEVHLSARQAGELAGRLGAGRLVVTHVAPSLSEEEQCRAAAEAFGGPVEPARTNVTYTAGDAFPGAIGTGEAR
jgi:ribonuclease BN (tRNA processing enzyme)